MTKGQHRHARQPLARARGGEGGQQRSTRPQSGPRKPAASTLAQSALRPSRHRTVAPLSPRSTAMQMQSGGSRHVEQRQLATEEMPADPLARRMPERVHKTEPDVSVTRLATRRITPAKKLQVRAPNQKILHRNRSLKNARVGSADIEPVRLQKALAQSGIGSRREMEEWIDAGLITVNGKVALLGNRVGPQDRVMVKGSPVRLKWADRLPRIILYHKKEGEMVTRSDPQGRITVFDRLPQAKSSRWVAVGRLDLSTSGLLILTTSGKLANRLMHPSFEVEREYAVRLFGQLTDENIKQLCDEVVLEDGPARVVRIVDQGGEGANHWYRVVIKEGRNREVRRLFEYCHVSVSRLIRVRFGNIGLPPRLKRGQFYELSEVEVAAVMKWSNLSITGEER